MWFFSSTPSAALIYDLLAGNAQLLAKCELRAATQISVCPVTAGTQMSPRQARLFQRYARRRESR